MSVGWKEVELWSQYPACSHCLLPVAGCCTDVVCCEHSSVHWLSAVVLVVGA